MEHKPNSGTIFRNDKSGDKVPDYTGTVNIEGVLYETAMWVNKPEGKKPYFSAKFTKKQDRQEQQTPQSEDNDLSF